jgi:hypothetical protein
MNAPISLLPEAISTISGYPLAKVRKDMPSREYTTYKSDWELFNRIWAYDYSVSTLNGRDPRPGEGKYNYYDFANYSEKMSYMNGQTAHVAYYITFTGIAPIGTFDTIQ